MLLWHYFRCFCVEPKHFNNGPVSVLLHTDPLPSSCLPSEYQPWSQPPQCPQHRNVHAHEHGLPRDHSFHYPSPHSHCSGRVRRLGIHPTLSSHALSCYCSLFTFPSMLPSPTYIFFPGWCVIILHASNHFCLVQLGSSSGQPSLAATIRDHSTVLYLTT